MRTISVSIDGEVGAAYIKASEQPVARTIPVTNSADVQVDVDESGALVGIELLGSDLVQGLREFAEGKRVSSDWLFEGE